MMKSSAFSFLSGVSLASSSPLPVKTPLLPAFPNSLATLDVFPFSTPELDLSKINLNPRLLFNNLRLLQEAGVL